MRSIMANKEQHQQKPKLKEKKAKKKVPRYEREAQATEGKGASKK
jgi:hypothetical protein